MTEHNTLYLASDAGLETTLKVFLSGIGIDADIEHEVIEQQQVVSATTYDFLADAKTVIEPNLSFISGKLGIVPSSKLIFGVHKDKDKDAVRTSIISGTLELLQRTPWDAGLLFRNGEIVVLLRRAGHLILNSREHIWTPERLKMVRLPYEMLDIVNL